MFSLNFTCSAYCKVFFFFVGGGGRGDMEISCQARVDQSSISLTKSLLKHSLTLLHSEWPKLHRVLAVLSVKGLSLLV